MLDYLACETEIPKNDPPYSGVLHNNTITTYFDIVGLQVLHSTQSLYAFVPQYIAYTVVTIVHLTFYTLYTDTIQYFYIYRILYRVVLFFEV